MSCDFCKKEFVSQDELQKHRTRKTPCITTMSQLLSVEDSFNKKLEEVKKRSISKNIELQLMYLEKIKSLESKVEYLEISNEKVRKELDKRFRHIKSLNQELYSTKALLAEHVSNKLEEDKEIYWTEINLTAPMLTKSARKSLKNEIKYFEDLNYVKEYIGAHYDATCVAVYGKKKERIMYVTITNSVEICSICFENDCMEKSDCQVCKYCYICAECQENVHKMSNECPFCGMTYNDSPMTCM